MSDLGRMTLKEVIELMTGLSSATPWAADKDFRLFFKTARGLDGFLLCGNWAIGA